MSDVYVNGKLEGTCDDPKEWVERIREQRRVGSIPKEVNIAYDEEQDIVLVNSEKGRSRRPLIVVKNGKSLLTKELYEKLEKGEISFNDLIKQGVVEYLDAEEEENTLIALNEAQLTPKHTHLELSPAIIFGSKASMVPFPEHNLSVRVMIGAKTMKQGIGVYASNYLLRMDTDANILHYPQRPIVNTYIYDVMDYDSHPVGQNIVIAVMSWHGYNMEDAIILNKSSVERGMYRSTFFRPYSAEELRYPGGQVDSIEIPNKEVKGYRTEKVYKHLEEDGIIYPEAIVNSGDILIGKTSPPRFLTSLEEFKMGVEERRETSSSVRFKEKGVVDSVLLTESEAGNKLVIVRVRDQRIPELGDKFSSRHGQKGVVGLLVPERDLPFTSKGVIPDIIFSPHSIPSRMTIGQLLEIIGGKVGAMSGKFVDASPFNAETEEDLRKQLLELGFREDGTEIMYDGKTGRQYKARIFIGDSFYLKLKHMVANRIHSRSRGPIQLLTRQPTEGRSKEGGLRLGEMENHCFVAHGASLILKERFDSDKTKIPVCKKCGSVAIYNRFRKKGTCLICGDNAEIGFVEMSYAFKLLLDELKSLCIYPKLNLKDKM